MLKYFLLWFPMLILAIMNGSARDLLYKKYVGELTAHQISTFSLIVLFAIYIYLIIIKFPPASVRHAFSVGLIWLILTLAFEIGFGLFNGRSWSELLADYNIFKGRLWILIPVWISLAPYIFYRIIR